MKTRDTIILGIALLASAIVWSYSFHAARKPDRVIRTVGSASRRFQTDTVKWTVRVVREAPPQNTAPTYSALRNDLNQIIEHLESQGIAHDNIAVQPLMTNPNYDREGQLRGYRLQQSMTVISNAVDTVDQLALNPDPIVSKGIIIEYSHLEYFYSKVDELKHELLGMAADDARQRAQEIASSTSSKIGAIHSARAGVFQITEPFSTEVSGYGIYNTTSKEKDIKITVHAEFNVK